MTADQLLSAFIAIFLLQTLSCLVVEYINQRNLARYRGSVPAPFTGMLNEHQMHRMAEYAKHNSRLFVVRKICKDVLLFGLIIFGGLKFIDGFGLNAGGSLVVSGLIFFLLLACIFFVLQLPFSYYRTFVLEEKFGFNRSTFQTWVLDRVKSGLIGAIILAVTLCPVLVTIEYFPTYWWLLGFLIVATVQFILLVLYPVVIAPLFNRFEPLKDPGLTRKVRDIIEKVGLQAGGIFQMDAGRRSGHTNAYFTGVGRVKRIVLFDTLIESHTEDEILAVLAHEIGHYKLRHVLKFLALSTTVTLAGFYVTYRLTELPGMYEAFGFGPDRIYAVLFVIAVFWQRLGWFLNPVSMALSRRFERQADRYAMDLLGTPFPMTGALRRLAKDNLANLNPHPLYVWFNYSHPPLVERIKALEGAAKPGIPDLRIPSNP